MRFAFFGKSTQTAVLPAFLENQTKPNQKSPECTEKPKCRSYFASGKGGAKDEAVLREARTGSSMASWGHWITARLKPAPPLDLPVLCANNSPLLFGLGSPRNRPALRQGFSGRQHQEGVWKRVWGRKCVL